MSAQHLHRRWNDCLSDWRNLILFVMAAAALISGSAVFAWDKLARPDIRCEIKKETAPIGEAQEYTLYLLMETMPDSTVDKATARYVANKKARSMEVKN